MHDGPALNMKGWTSTPGPNSRAKYPPAIPTRACAWVILGKYPTRTLIFRAGAAWAKKTVKSSMKRRKKTFSRRIKRPPFTSQYMHNGEKRLKSGGICSKKYVSFVWQKTM